MSDQIKVTEAITKVVAMEALNVGGWSCFLLLGKQHQKNGFSFMTSFESVVT